MKRLRALWASLAADVDRRVRLGRILGLAFVVIGFVVIAKAWDGAASKQYIQQMFPYLLSGGFLGLGLVITGATLLFLATVRAERQVLTDRYEEMSTLLSRNLSRLALSANGAATSGEQVLAGATAYHRPGCRVLQGKENLNLMTISLEQAVAEGLEACRVCDPPTPPEEDQGATAAGAAQAENAEAEADGAGPDDDPGAEPGATEAEAATAGSEKPSP